MHCLCNMSLLVHSDHLDLFFLRVNGIPCQRSGTIPGWTTLGVLTVIEGEFPEQSEVTATKSWGHKPALLRPPARGQECPCPCFVTRLWHRQWSCSQAQLDSPLAGTMQQLGHPTGAFTLSFPLSRLCGRTVLWAVGTLQCNLCPVFPGVGSYPLFPRL